MEKYDVKFKKKFGQNFLKDINIVKKIVKVADIKEKSLVIEVGPGGAIMTRELSFVSDNVLAYEIDNDLEIEQNKRLENCNNVKILFKDFLESDLISDVSLYEYDNLYFVSNVPYYITTPILLKLINSNLKFKKIVMMVQKEVGDRFSTVPGNKEYGSITVLLNYFFNVKKEFNVSRKQFVPEPNVDSVIVSLGTGPNPIIQRSAKNEDLDLNTDNKGYIIINEKGETSIESIYAGYIYDEPDLIATGHNYSNGVCTICGITNTNKCGDNVVTFCRKEQKEKSPTA